MLISIIIPCYNEEKRISKILTAISEYIHDLPKDSPYTFEVIVVDNGSKDNTQKKVLTFEKSLPNLQILTEASHGKGWAVKQGMLAAHGEYRLFTDADNSTDIHHIEKLLQATIEGYDVVISSRKLSLSHIIYRQPFYREFLGNIFAALTHMIVPLGIKDTQNGFKLFSREAAEKIFPHQSTFYWAFDIEVLGIAKKLGFKIKEVPITWVNDEQSKMNLKGMTRMLFEVFMIRLHLWTRDYIKKSRVVEPIHLMEQTDPSHTAYHANHAKIHHVKPAANHVHAHTHTHVKAH